MALLRGCLAMVREAHGVSGPPPLPSRRPQGVLATSVPAHGLLRIAHAARADDGPHPAPPAGPAPQPGHQPSA